MKNVLFSIVFFFCVAFKLCASSTYRRTRRLIAPLPIAARSGSFDDFESPLGLLKARVVLLIYPYQTTQTLQLEPRIHCLHTAWL